MARTPSNMVPLGSKAPDFQLPEPLTGQVRSLSELKSDQATVIMFICNHCPFVKHVESELIRLASEYQTKGVSFVAINANDAEQYPDDAPDKMAEMAREKGYPFPYLHDETQEVAKAYDAACTPDFYLFNGQLALVYRGQLDDSRPDSGIPVTGRDIRAALDAILAGQPIDDNQRPSLGCNIKWKA
ncbi:thioredoxin family protein [Xylanibacillus composti]|uniref:Thioredoxin family protein n=1 Tax=Xylanibacillus composti TaxID=1572762 RepID=A0A8J4H283_9BACL|nr:thioredoxin family protein [Xylanibacillus composti]MDT9724223.1 thioredoxin family protein [Xylanibacillus composti]GIQ68260.1 thioredoxin family protein [Xylanibacillus composti]